MNAHLILISLWSEDVAKSVHFYRDLIGLPMRGPHVDRPHFELGDGFLVILKGRPKPAENSIPERFPVLAFAVEDLDSAISQLAASGIDLPWGVEEDKNSRWVMFYDPGGNLIELAQFSKPAVA